jgi:hypothetical protein
MTSPALRAVEAGRAVVRDMEAPGLPRPDSHRRKGTSAHMRPWPLHRAIVPYEYRPRLRSLAHQMTLLPARMRRPNMSHPVLPTDTAPEARRSTGSIIAR